MRRAGRITDLHGSLVWNHEVSNGGCMDGNMFLTAVVNGRFCIGLKGVLTSLHGVINISRQGKYSL
jgi:hypothetical protein